jgi:hypothetical protein
MKTQTRLAISLSNDPMDTEYVTLKEAQKIQDLLDYTRKIASVQDKDLESLKVKVEDANKKLELNDHNAKVLLKVADNEITRLKALVYCQCKEPNYNKFGMDNQCARCRKPIENHPLSLSQEPTSKHYVDVQGMDENLKSDLDHCFCPICNHRAVQTCIDEKCTCCITSVANGVQEEKTELP